jgi:hypothetical protein
MELLLLLSAFLSALTGAITGVRGPDLRPSQSVVASSAVQAVRASAVIVATERPSAADLSLLSHIGAGTSVAFAIVRAVPLYTSRPRV